MKRNYNLSQLSTKIKEVPVVKTSVKIVLDDLKFIRFLGKGSFGIVQLVEHTNGT